MKEIFLKQEAYYKKGYTQSITYRESMLVLLKKTIKAHEDEILNALFLDLGKHPKESYITELFMVYKSINHMIKNVHKYSKEKRVKTPFLLKPGRSFLRHIPYGNVLVMSAYNYPLLLSLDPLIGSIAGGNTTMLALSSNSKHTNEVLIRILNESFSVEYLYAFETNRSLNAEILDYPFDKIFFTGSKNVGKVVLEKASNNLVNTTLELGGKSPAFVLRDAKLKDAADNIMYSKVINAGQTCIASDYVLVDQAIADDFIEQLEVSFNSFYPNLENYPKLINQKSYDRIQSLIEEDKDYIVNDYVFDEEVLKIKPVILKAKLSEMNQLSSMTDEIFGPILPVIVFDNLDEAIYQVSEKETPLALYVFGRRYQNIARVISFVDAGGVSINATLLHMVNEHLPFSGFRSSGLGSYHGRYSFDCFTYTQGIYKKGFLQSHKIIFPPYKK